MRIRATVLAIVGLTTLAGAAPAMAQANFVAAVGASFLREADISQTAKGLAADAAINFGNKVKGGGVFDLGFNKFTGCTEKSYAGGGRLTAEAGPKVSVHGQWVFGKASCGGGGSERMDQPGFGVDLMLNDTVGIRGQFDLRRLHFTDGNINEQRFWFGISFHSR